MPATRQAGIEALTNLKVLAASKVKDLAVEGEWAFARQEEPRRSYHEALLLLGGLLSTKERHAEAADTYRKAISHDRYVEEAHRGLMRTQAAVGERGRALRHFEEFVGLLENELGCLAFPRDGRALRRPARRREALELALRALRLQHSAFSVSAEAARYAVPPSLTFPADRRLLIRKSRDHLRG